MKRFIAVAIALLLPAITAAPTFAVLVNAPVTDDTYVVSNWPDINYGDNVSMTAGTVGSVDIHYRIYLKFDLSGLPAGATIRSVRLSLYCNARVGSPILTVYHANPQLDDGPVWTEHNVTWNQQPGRTIDLGSVAGLTAKTWITWDLLPSGITPADLANESLSFQIGQDSGSVNNYGNFVTKEGADPALAPKLEINYNLAKGQPSLLLLLD